MDENGNNLLKIELGKSKKKILKQKHALGTRDQEATMSKVGLS